MSKTQFQMRPIIAAIKAAPMPSADKKATTSQSSIFVTVSREAGAGAVHFAERLTKRINELDKSPQQWNYLDKELVERIAKDLKISQHLVETLEETCHSWLDDFWRGLSISRNQDPPTETLIYRRVVAMIRVLARAGKAVIVGRGSVYITQSLPGGVHIRLIAPLAYRIDRFAAMNNLNQRAAAMKIKQLDENRDAFYQRYWPKKSLGSETFHVTLNTALIPEEQLIDCVLPLIKL